MGKRKTIEPTAEDVDEVHYIALAASIPASMRWLDADGVGAMLGYSRSHVLQRLAGRADFPRPLNEGQPRWLASEVAEWARLRRDDPRPVRRKRKKAEAA